MATSADTPTYTETAAHTDTSAPARADAPAETTATPSAGTATLAPPRPATPIPGPTGPRPDFEPEPSGTAERILVGVFVGVPMLALLAAAPLAWGWGLTWHDIVIAVVFYYLSGLGISMGFHRYFTHGSFKATRSFKIALAVAGTLALEGPVLTWVADHRRHHKYSDKEGDPHSPWRYGNDWKALTKGLAFAHMGWMFDPNKTSQEKFCPDWLADDDIRKVSKLFPWLVAASMLAPALIGGLWAWSWEGAVTAFFWASLVRVAFLHHVTWSINSICHTFGKEEFEVRDKSRNVNWLAILSFGESWHNLHHSDPTCARHGALRGQIDIAARLIWLFEKAGWATDVRWPDEARLAPRQTRSRKLGGMTHRADAEPIRRAQA
jgi:stearoyl-CoA desaturase (Delta-9 desaturase)